MKFFFYKLKLLFLRVLCYEKPLRVAFTKFLSLKFSNFRPHYESLIYETSKNAIKLGFNEISVVTSVSNDDILLKLKEKLKKF